MVSTVSQLKRLSRELRVAAKQRPATVVRTRTVGKRDEVLHPTKGWRRLRYQFLKKDAINVSATH